MRSRTGVTDGGRDDPREDAGLEAVGQMCRELAEVAWINMCSVVEGWPTMTKISAVALNVIEGQCELNTSWFGGMVSGIAERLRGWG